MTAAGHPGVQPSLGDAEGSPRPARPAENQLGLYGDTHFKKSKLHSSDSVPPIAGRDDKDRE